MINKLSTLKIKMMLTALILLTVFSVHAQHTTTIGNTPRTGSSNSTFAVIKGQQVGIKMNAGKKMVKLLKLNFGVENHSNDTLKFKVNVYGFNGTLPDDNLVKQIITGGIPKGNSRVIVDLSPYDIEVNGNILVSIEWLNTQQVTEPSFHIGLFNGGTWNYENNAWKHTPVAGVDFSVLVEKLK
ncbi:hypothetical protein [Mucilaginibacter jinjuensis]|uniref:Uncharacterized protein n=1 Tax=Mucilaginibacter jinjuensis TaxID=1176721 RepID=A0ABY7TEW8_9SPHI|nr:hypothetical protein [Mucilaginibacter jinjuensis]WCT13717.1 hypothetical protein PQO05_07185 [Mucilaginibacter jinjuensis]